MKKWIVMVMFAFSMTMSTTSEAAWITDIIRLLKKQAEMTNGYLKMLSDTEGEMLSTEKSIEGLMEDVKGSLQGRNEWGSYGYVDYMSYGAGARSWRDVLNMTTGGGVGGELGHVMSEIANQFPIDTTLFNQGVADLEAQKYYALQAGTVLATRAASQLDFNKIQEQIDYQNKLRKSVGKSQNLKESVDLSSRIQVEGNLIALQILREVAVANQQRAVSDEATVLSALSNARFLSNQ